MSEIRKVLLELLEKKISLDDAEKLLKANIIKEVGDLAKLDIFRKTRTGVPEVIYAQNKDTNILSDIITGFIESKKFAIVTRYNEVQKKLILERFGKNKDLEIEINKMGNIIIVKEKSFKFTETEGIVGIITAGSSDIPIANEAEVIVKAMGCEVISSYDVGIAGIHRIFTPLSNMIKKGVHVIIVCAGMEGTLPGVVASLVDVPIIGVPISSGYGIGEKGKGALTTMLQSCSPGLLVVNIDNGFGAGVSAAIIANKIAK
ncbi:MAG: nickel pincer cofactor biosynthesis protein LarB [Candidatus Odinarchaeota archaeon]